MEAVYDPLQIEAWVRDQWSAAGSIRVDRTKDAEPSLAQLRRCTIRDVITRYQRMQGLHRPQLEGEPCAVDWHVVGGDAKDRGHPAPILETYGADAVRLCFVSNSPPDRCLEWHDSNVQGARRFLRKLWRLIYRHTLGGPTEALATCVLDEEAKAMRRRTHEAITKVTDQIDRRRAFHTAVAAIMELVNAVIDFEQMDETGRAVTQEALATVVRMLSPIAPYLTQVLWEGLGHEGILLDAAWPKVDAAALVRDDVAWVVQVNGKLRGRIEVPQAASRGQVEALARAAGTVARNIQGKRISKVIFVPGKLVNLVVTG